MVLHLAVLVVAPKQGHILTAVFLEIICKYDFDFQISMIMLFTI